MTDNRFLRKPSFKPLLFRQSAVGGVSEELDTRGADRLCVFASGADAKAITVRVWGKIRVEAPASTETTTPPTTVPAEIPDLGEEGYAWVVLGELTCTVAAASSPDAPDGRASEYSSPIQKIDCQMCHAIKVVGKTVSGPITLWGATSEAQYLG